MRGEQEKKGKAGKKKNKRQSLVHALITQMPKHTNQMQSAFPSQCDSEQMWGNLKATVKNE